jgi:hypothetical protein
MFVFTLVFYSNQLLFYFLFFINFLAYVLLFDFNTYDIRVAEPLYQQCSNPTVPRVNGSLIRFDIQSETG